MKFTFTLILILFSFFTKAQVVDTIRIRNSLGDIAYAVVMDTATSAGSNYIFVHKNSGGLGLMAAASLKVQRYGNSGLSTLPLKIYDTVITNPSTASGFTVSVSHVGFTSTPTVMANGLRSTTDATLAPQVSLKSVSSTSLVMNITQGNSSTINLLGSLVLLGASSAFATTLSGVSVHIIAFGY